MYYSPDMNSPKKSLDIITLKIYRYSGNCMAYTPKYREARKSSCGCKSKWGKDRHIVIEASCQKAAEKQSG